MAKVNSQRFSFFPFFLLCGSPFAVPLSGAHRINHPIYQILTNIKMLMDFY